MLPGDVAAPVGTITRPAVGLLMGVMSTTSGVGDSTEIAVTSHEREANVNVQPPVVNAGTSHPDQVTRKVAEPRTKSPTLPPRDAELTVALPVKETPPAA